MIVDLVLGLGKQLLGVIDKSVQDKDLKERLKSELEKTILQNSMEFAKLQAQIITAEAKSESWLTRNWRPLVMLTFTALMVADWLGFTAPNLTPELKMKLFDIIHVGLGGYVIGRSAEKVLPRVAQIVAPRTKSTKRVSERDSWLEEDM